MRISLAFLALISTSLFALGADSLIGRLDPDQKKELTDGETVVISKDLPGEAWPKLQLYRIVDADTSVVANLFSDYASAPDYTPGMIAAEVIAEPEKNTKDVRYTVQVPVLKKISYSVRNKYQKNGNSYVVSWHLLDSPLASASTGSLEIEPYGKKTLLCYTNHVTPKIPMAGALKGNALKEAKTTIEAIAKESARRASAQ